MKYPRLHHAFRVTSHLTVEERVRLYELAASARHIAEIGAYIGASACCFGAALQPRGAGKIICIDTWNNDAMSEGPRDTWQAFAHNTRQYASFITPVRGFSTEVVDRVRQISPELDLLFIDGDHSYASVKADWACYQGFLRKGATVVFHDYGWAEGVQRVVHEDVLPRVSAHARLPNMWWGTIGEVA